MTGDCEPLQRGLENVTGNPARVLKAILSWTGGQPFLTQVLCDLVAKGSAISEDTNVEEYIDTLVQDRDAGQLETARLAQSLSWD